MEEAKLGEVVTVKILTSVDGRVSGSKINADIVAPTSFAILVIDAFTRYIQDALRLAGVPLKRMDGPTSFPIPKWSAWEITASRFIGVETGMFAQDLANNSSPRPMPGQGIVRLKSDRQEA